MKKTFMSIIMMVAMLSINFAQVDSEWRSDDRDGIYQGEKLLKKWPASGPSLITTIKNLGIGYSSPAVTNNRIYVTGMIDETGYIFAFDLKGKQIWKSAYGEEWQDGYDGARSTPTVVNDKIYFTSSLGVIYCFNSKGKNVWSVDMKREFDSPNIRWGITESLLIDGDNLYCTPGSDDVSVAVLNRNTGKTLEKINVNGQTSAYCSPMIFNHNGRRILTTMLGESVIGIDVKTNKPLFEYPHKTKYNINPNTPIYKDGYLYAVSGYGTGGQLFKLSDNGDKITRVWQDEELDSQMGSAIIFDNHIYGSGHNNRFWHCIEFLTGKVKYSARELGRKGNIIFADGLLYLYSEKGDIALVKPNPEKFDIISSFELKDGDGEHWAHPVIKDGKLFVRHGNILNIYNIAR